MREPIFHQCTLLGLADYANIAGGAWKSNLGHVSSCSSPEEGLEKVLLMSELRTIQATSTESPWPGEVQTRLSALEREVRDFTPWFLPEYEPLRNLNKSELDFPSQSPVPNKARTFYRSLEEKLDRFVENSNLPATTIDLCLRLRRQLTESQSKLEQVATRMRAISSLCERMVKEMNFEMLVDNDRRLLSIGYDVTKKELNKSCYDLLASESRTATFVAVAKGETLQESWFRLGRQHTLAEGESVLISWTGTMFEYLMPVIWEKSHPDTLLDRSTRSAVRAQQSYAKSRRIPWGISEAAYSKTDEDGNYQYSAFGVPSLALSVSRESRLVVSPYSSCLALLVDAATAVENLMGMARRKWLADFGFYESIDYSSVASTLGRRKHEVIRCWMAHHQGMSLAAICNVLRESAFQRWFHAEPLVQASDLVLQERPLRARPIADGQPRRVFSFARSIFRNAEARTKASA